jgi:hypothetical protein
MAALSDSGDQTTFEGASSPWSQADNHAPVIRPNGLISGGEITPAASGTNDYVDVAAGTAYIAGSLVTWSADTDVEITRGLTTDTHNITSITVTSGGSIAAVSGTDHTAFSETRAADGGPPLIAVTSVELGQVRTTSVTAAAVASSVIFSTVGTHTERYDYPAWTVDHFNGEITFIAALPKTHTGTLPKAVYASFSTPVFVDIQYGNDFVPPETSYSVSSTQVYNGTIGATSESLNAGSFTAYLSDGTTDNLLSWKGQNLWFKFFPNRYNDPYIACQGILGVTRSFPAGDNISAACTINAESEAVNQSS